MKDMLTLGEACRLASVSPETVRRWCNTGRLAHRRATTGHRLIDGQSLQLIIDARKRAAARPQEPRS